MMRTIPKVALLIGALAVAGQASAHGGWGPGPAIFGAVVGAAVVGSIIAGPEPRPVYVQQPVYVQPQPVYVQAPPVYYQPQPVYVQPPQPVYYQGYYGRPHPAGVPTRVRMRMPRLRPDSIVANGTAYSAWKCSTAP